MSSHSMLFCYNVEAKMWFLAGAAICVELAYCPMSVWVFSRCSVFFPHPKHGPVRLTSVSQFSQSEWVGGGCEWPSDGRMSCPGWGPVLSLSWQGRIWPPVAWHRNKQGGKELYYLFLFNFLKCMYSSHLFWCFILEVFEVFFGSSVNFCVCDRKHAIGTSSFTSISPW